LAELRNAIADYLKRRFDVEMDPERNILPTAGSKEAIFSTALAFIDRSHDEAVAFGTPGYPVYQWGARLAGAAAIPVELQGDFVLRASDLSAEDWRRARLLWICTPHNPTGAVTARAELADLVSVARQNQTLLLSDECYADLYEDQPPPSVLEVAGPGAAGVLAYLSLSKRSGMTGYRSGAVVGDAEVLQTLRTTRAAAGVAPAEFVQKAAAAAWSDDLHAAERRAIFAAKRGALRVAFKELGMPVVGSRAGIYLWVEVGDGDKIAARLAEAGVVVSPGSAFGGGGEGFIRLALVPPLDECTRAAEVLVECLQ
jgi:aspartate/methionine/tyrosine aminotransferase